MSSEAARYEAVIGLEVHAQLLTHSKAFCGCPTAYGAAPNTQVCPVCLGLPGALPVLNGEAVRLAVRTALALSCSIRPSSRFARKNYFYPDLPKGYQISQYDEPFSDRGHLEIEVAGAKKTVGITRVHMEEDAGKNVHLESASVVDLNRSGVPLVEIVGDPDLRSGAEAAEYLRTLREILVFIGVNDGNLEEGSFRCDANVSIRPIGETKLGTRVELKNINSFRFVEKAIAYEIERQAGVLAGGGRIVQETRGWNEDKGTTFSMRSKEEAQDYRYFPDPDLPPLRLEDAFVEEVKASMPELPGAKRRRFTSEMGLTPYAAQVLTAHPQVAAFFEEAAALYADATGAGDSTASATRVANFIQSEVLRDVQSHGLTSTIPVSARQVADLLVLVDQGKISGKQAKEVYSAIAGTAQSPADVISRLGMQQVSDAGQIEQVVAQVIERSPKQAEQLRAGKASLMGFFVGQVMKETKGAANPQMVNDLLKKRLGLG
ncbi:MAG TPA: Asp-tRNA(Asn)/Glu-tRNA(Gln) amidotransferase subunit GatB [Polyangiaceae bacterium]|nr:Asp-tRNA(Asn)/Glu-tRNA(Gln) amidotransferase subunit GatB [Polyangiaceae bacterium]